jgi:hypothetical protein
VKARFLRIQELKKINMAGKKINGRKFAFCKEKPKTKKFENIRGTSAPEYFLFGFLFASALLFSIASFQGAEKIPTSFQMVDYERGRIILENRIRNLTKGYPIEKMSPYISRKNRRVASFLVAIAKKESNWGRHAPNKNGKECFNYWGYRGPENPTATGYSCFDSPEQAVRVVGKRINKLVVGEIDTPEEMVVWKCGSLNCARLDHDAVKWIWDVDNYFQKIYPSVKNRKNKTVALELKE